MLHYMGSVSILNRFVFAEKEIKQIVFTLFHSSQVCEKARSTE